MLCQKQAGVAGDAPSAAASPSGTPASVFPEHKNIIPATSQPRENTGKPEGNPDLHTGITAPCQLRNSKALLRRCYVRTLHPQTTHVVSLSRRAVTAPAPPSTYTPCKRRSSAQAPPAVLGHSHLGGSHSVIQHLVTITQISQPGS